MNRNLHSPTKLTEFARDFEEESETLFSKFVNKLTNAYNSSYNSVNELNATGFPATVSDRDVVNSNVNTISRTSSSSSLNSIKPTSLQVATDKSNSTSTSSTTEDNSESPERVEDMPIEVAEGRTMLNVLKRISNIVAARNNNLRSYKDTELQRFWMPDSKAKECYDCGQKFSTFRRKHHCRLCGQIFCSKCCNQVVPGHLLMCSGNLKVCTYCSKIVLSYIQSNDITIDLRADLQALQDDLSNKLSPNQGEVSKNVPTLQRKKSIGYQEERWVGTQVTNLSNADRKNILQQSNSLKMLHEEMIRQLPEQRCGSELIDFLKINQKSSNKVQAVAILNAMLEAGFLVPIVPDSDNLDFDENLHYKLVCTNDVVGSPLQSCEDYEISSVLENRAKEDGSQFDDPFLPKSLDNSISFQSIKEMELENSIRSKATTTTEFVKAYCDHEELLLGQVLRNLNLDQSWSKILITLCARAANQFRPELCSNDLMDIRNYINFKKIPGGSRSDSNIVGGVVFTKNVAHKEMANRVEKPKILLLECPIVYERVEGKFVSIETLLLQEKEYLRNVTARILSWKAKVVLVHKNVAGIAQDMLRAKGITLVLDVKSSVLERLSRCLQCDVVTSIESNIGKPKLGTCDVFYTKSFDDGAGGRKTLMFFEIFSSPPGCCCLLRGANNNELARVKKAASLLVYARECINKIICQMNPSSSNLEEDEHTCDESDELFMNKVANIRRRRRRAGRNQKDLKISSSSEAPTETTPLIPSLDEDKMRQKLQFFFMNPLKKWQTLGKFPYMFILQVTKMILVTMQLYIFAYSRYKQVDYTWDNKVTFSNLFLKGWVASMETKSNQHFTAPLAIYKKAEFFETIDYAFTKYASLSKDRGPYSYSSLDNQMTPMKLCLYSYREGLIFGFNDSYIFNPEIDRKCLNLTANMTGMRSSEFLKKNNFSVRFSALVKATLKFVIKTINFKNYGPLSAPDCFEFVVTILLDNSDHDGQIMLSLNTVATRRHCSGVFKYIIGLKYNPVLCSLLNLMVILVCVTSSVICTKTLYKGQVLRRESVDFFLFKYKKELTFKEEMEFFNLWYITVIFNDIFVIIGSFLKEQVDRKFFETDGWDWDLCSIFIGLGNLLAWFEVLQYLRYFKSCRMVILALKKSTWKICRMCLSVFLMYLGFIFCGWVIFAPYNTKFRSLSSTSESLFSIASGDEINSSFAMMSRRSMMVWWFSKIYLYAFTCLFIYVGVVLFIAVVEEYDIIKQYYEKELPKSYLQEFIGLKSTISSGSIFHSHFDKGKRPSLTEYFSTCGVKTKSKPRS